MSSNHTNFFKKNRLYTFFYVWKVCIISFFSNENFVSHSIICIILLRGPVIFGSDINSEIFGASEHAPMMSYHFNFSVQEI